MKQLIVATALLMALGSAAEAADDCNTTLAGPDNRRPAWAGEGLYPGSLDLARGMDREHFAKNHSEEDYGNFLVGHSWKYLGKVLTFREKEIEALSINSDTEFMERLGGNYGSFPVSRYKLRMLPSERGPELRLFIEPIYKDRVPTSHGSERTEITDWAAQGFMLRSPFRGGRMVPARIVKNLAGQEWLRIAADPHDSFSRVIGFYDRGNDVLGKWDTETAVYEFTCDAVSIIPKETGSEELLIPIVGYETVLSGPDPFAKSAYNIDPQFYITRVTFEQPLAALRKQHPELANWTGDFRLMYQSAKPRDARIYLESPDQKVLVSQISDQRPAKLAWMLEQEIVDDDLHARVTEAHAANHLDPKFEEYDRFLIQNRAKYPDYPHFEPVTLAGPKPVLKRKTTPWEK